MGNSQQEQVFRPARTKFWGPLVVGIFLTLLGSGFLLLPIYMGTRQGVVVLLMLTLCDAALIMSGLWCLWAAWAVAGAVVRIGDEGVELKVSPWSIWKRTRARRARLGWDEIQGVKLCLIDNFLMPSGADDNYILATSQGEFVVQGTIWGERAQQIAKLIADHLQQPIHRPVPADGGPPAGTLSASDGWVVKLVRGFGWLCTALVCVFIVLLSIALLAAKPEERLGLAKAVFYGLCVLAGAGALRRFKIRMG